jgi:hypothetical protein
MPCTRTGIPLRSIPAGDGHVRPAYGGTNAELSCTLRFDALQAARTNRSGGNPALWDSTLGWRKRKKLSFPFPPSRGYAQRGIIFSDLEKKS